MKDGIPREDFVYGETKTLENVVEYQSDLDTDYPDIVGWREVGGKKRFFRSESLAELWLERLLAH